MTLTLYTVRSCDWQLDNERFIIIINHMELHCSIWTLC